MSLSIDPAAMEIVKIIKKIEHAEKKSRPQPQLNSTEMLSLLKVIGAYQRDIQQSLVADQNTMDAKNLIENYILSKLSKVSLFRLLEALYSTQYTMMKSDLGDSTSQIAFPYLFSFCQQQRQDMPDLELHMQRYALKFQGD